MKYSPELIKEICSYIEAGAYNDDACIQAGLSESEFYLWQSDSVKNPLSEEQKSELSESMRRAKSKRTTVLANRIVRASEDEYMKDDKGEFVLDKVGRKIVIARGDWKASAFYLERTESDKFAKKEELKHTGEVASKVDLGVPKEVIDVFRDAIKTALRRKPAEPSDKGQPTNMDDTEVQDI
jgi:hypothetical protein